MSDLNPAKNLERVARALAVRAVKWARPLVAPASLVDPPYGLRRTAAVIMQRAVTPYVPMSKRVRSLARVADVDLIAVYRRRNAATVAALEAAVSGSTRLWALDVVDPSLKNVTVGEGAGTRFENLNRLATSSGDNRWLVVADDDVRFSSGDLADAVALAAAAGLDVAMPSHDRDSFINWSVTRCRPGSLVRLCRFVDQGPVLILSPRARQHLLPFDETSGMGWGAELSWAADSRLRIGILDGVRIQHLFPVSTTAYDVDEEWQRAVQALADSPWATWGEAQVELQRWTRWHHRPPWSTETV